MKQENKDGERFEAHTLTKEEYAAEEVRKALTEDAKRRSRGVPDCECGAQMDLGSYSPDGSGCDWICWGCIDAGNPPGIASAITISDALSVLSEYADGLTTQKRYTMAAQIRDVVDLIEAARETGPE